MIVEIKNAGFENKGAELMLRTIMQVMGDEHTYVMEFNLNSAPYEKRARLGIYQKSGIVKFGVQFDWFLGLLPQKLLNMLGIILNKDIDVVFDASGFAYGTPWNDDNIKKILTVSNNTKRYDQKLIFLPQAFGKFEGRQSREKMKKVFENATLIFARDEISLKNIENIAPKDKLYLAKDFTNLLKVEKNIEEVKNAVVVIPNCRMLDKSDGDLYLKLLDRVIEILSEKEEKIILLNHEGKGDLALCEQLSKKWGNLKIIRGGDTLFIKSAIGSSKGVISSRFHGIVSGLSQGVVTIGTSWSHKYKALYHDYNFNDGLIDDLDINDDVLIEKLSFILDNEKRKKIVGKLTMKSNELNDESMSIWELIKSML
ncbi:colanic acid/amylovoran biosynthesis protein [Balneicella halophila]|uniref:Colanic acid/amylovoran biosynthesis protein n=1 Tax=Balneicella halophila TaxID=1537566 RepID=A0A7L4UR28_BALHA|nr:polysaccharide pyruvyl transferase family protein [Balneicella halophila]PVX50749.1 colanic acid/amylovoran biosynthesis protein [Balneicella halophila]